MMLCSTNQIVQVMNIASPIHSARNRLRCGNRACRNPMVSGTLPGHTGMRCRSDSTTTAP